MVETLHQLALGLGGGLDEQLGGGHELSRLRRQKLLGSRKFDVATPGHVSVSAEGPGLPYVGHHLGHNLLGFLEHYETSCLFKSIIIRLGIIDTSALQGVIMIKFTIGVHLSMVSVGDTMTINMTVIL